MMRFLTQPVQESMPHQETLMDENYDTIEPDGGPFTTTDPAIPTLLWSAESHPMNRPSLSPEASLRR